MVQKYIQPRVYIPAPPGYITSGSSWEYEEGTVAVFVMVVATTTVTSGCNGSGYSHNNEKAIKEL